MIHTGAGYKSTASCGRAEVMFLCGPSPFCVPEADAAWHENIYRPSNKLAWPAPTRGARQNEVISVRMRLPLRVEASGGHGGSRAFSRITLSRIVGAACGAQGNMRGLHSGVAGTAESQPPQNPILPETSQLGFPACVHAER